MNGAHATGASIGALIGAVVAQVLSHFANVTLDSADAALIGSAAVAAGVGLGHLFSGPGLVPAIRRGLFGQKPAPPPIVVVPSSPSQSSPPLPPPTPPLA